MSYKDREKRIEYSKAWHKKNYNGEYRQARLDNAKARHKDLERDFKQYKKTLCCSVCGENDACCLDFHHKDPTKKDMTISSAIGNNWSWKRLMVEIEKCEVLCSNCHRKFHKIKDAGECSKD